MTNALIQQKGPINFHEALWKSVHNLDNKSGHEIAPITREAFEAAKNDPTIYQTVGEIFKYLAKCRLVAGIGFTATAAVSAFVEDLNAYFVFPAIVSLFAAKFFKDSHNFNKDAQKFFDLAKTHKITSIAAQPSPVSLSADALESKLA